jgi:hypothetical protein
MIARDSPSDTRYRKTLSMAQRLSRTQATATRGDSLVVGPDPALQAQPGEALSGMPREMVNREIVFRVQSSLPPEHPDRAGTPAQLLAPPFRSPRKSVFSCFTTRVPGSIFSYSSGISSRSFPNPGPPKKYRRAEKWFKIKGATKMSGRSAAW